MEKLLQPFPWLVILAVASLIVAEWRKYVPRWLRVVPTVVAISLQLWTLPATSRVFSRLVERAERMSVGKAGAILVLGGGMIPATTLSNVVDTDPTNASTPFQANLNNESLERCLAAAEVARSAPHLPLLICGGSPAPDLPAVSQQMEQFLDHCGIPPGNLHVETNSQSTAQNAREAAQWLKEQGMAEVVLVTHAYHLPRASRLLQGEGIRVRPYASRSFQDELPWNIWSFWPSSQAATINQKLFREVLATMKDWVLN
jgi:uncharacterized SAM-binding protein YcdF (DUF218 family)